MIYYLEFYMFKKSLLAIAMTACATSAFAGASISTAKVPMPLSSTAESGDAVSGSFPVTITAGAAQIDLSTEPTATVEFTLANASVSLLPREADFILPPGIVFDEDEVHAVFLKSSTDNVVVLKLKTAGVVSEGDRIVWNLNGLVLGANWETNDVSVSATISEISGEPNGLEEALGAVDTSTATSPDTDNTDSIPGTPENLINSINPVSAVLTKSPDAMISEDDQAFTVGSSATLGVVTLKSSGAVGVDGKAYDLGSGDTVTVSVNVDHLDGLSSVSVGDVTNSVKSGAVAAFEFSGADYGSTYNVVLNADSDAETDIKQSTTNTIGIDFSTEQSGSEIQLGAINITDLDNAAADDIASVIDFGLENNYNVNVITVPGSSDETYVRFTNRSPSPATVYIDLTGQDGESLGKGYYGDNVEPGATIVLNSNDFLTIAGGTAWDGRANAVISTNVDADVTALLKSGGTLSNMSGEVSD